jgi:hypothetical protein
MVSGSTVSSAAGGGLTAGIGTAISSLARAMFALPPALASSRSGGCDETVGDGDAVGVAGEVGEHCFWPGEGGLA